MSNNEFYSHKKSDKIKWIATALAGIILAGASATTLAMGIKNNGWFAKEETPIDQPADQTPDSGDNVADGGFVVNPVSTKSMRLVATPLSLTSTDETSDDGISAQAETSYSLTATITPSDADNKAVDWSVAWVNPSATWASGKTVTDYVTITPSTDGALTATLSCKQAFGAQVKVIVTSRDNTALTAQCTADYVRRVKAINFTVGNMSFAEMSYSYTVTYSDYTLNSTFALGNTARLELTSGFNTAVVNNVGSKYAFGAMNAGDYWLQIGGTSVNLNLTSKKLKTVATKPNSFYTYDMDSYDGSWGAAWASAVDTAFKSAVNTYTGTQAVLTLNYTNKYNGTDYGSGTTAVNVKFDYSAMKISASGVTLNGSTNYIF